MSQTDPDAVTVSQAGFTVEKTLNTEDFQTLAIMFEIAADPDTGGRFVLRDTIPEGLPLDDVGFHPEYGAEYWTADGREVVFEREFEAGEEYTTIYGLRNYDLDEREGPLNDPVIDVPEPEPDTEEAATETSPADAEPDAEAAPTAPEATGTADTTDEPDADDAATLELGADADVAEPAGAGTDEEATATMPAGGVGRVLAKELREGRIAEEDRQVLRDELLTEPQSTEVRVERLESRVSELDAYTDALEEFIDEHGAKEVLDDIDEELTAVREEVEATREEVEHMDERMGTFEDRLEELATDLDRIDDVSGEVAQLEEDIDDIYDELDDLAEFRERLSSALGAYGGGGDEDEE